MKKQDVLKDIQQTWIHSHEEDTAEEAVYRPADYDFPLSRGRAGFELKPNHELSELNIAATDGTEEATGRWDLKTNKDDLTLELKSENSGSTDLKIESVSKDRLIVKK